LSLEGNISICKKYLEEFAKMGIVLEFELVVTRGEEDGVDNTDMDSSCLYTQLEPVMPTNNFPKSKTMPTIALLPSELEYLLQEMISNL